MNNIIEKFRIKTLSLQSRRLGIQLSDLKQRETQKDRRMGWAEVVKTI